MFKHRRLSPAIARRVRSYAAVASAYTVGGSERDVVRAERGLRPIPQAFRDCDEDAEEIAASRPLSTVVPVPSAIRQRAIIRELDAALAVPAVEPVRRRTIQPDPHPAAESPVAETQQERRP